MEVRWDRSVRPEATLSHGQWGTSDQGADAVLAAYLGPPAELLGTDVQGGGTYWRGGPTTDERERITALERENRELHRANEILRKASADFAMAELDRRSRT